MSAVKPSELRFFNSGKPESGNPDVFAVLQVMTPTGRLRRVDLTRTQAMSILVQFALILGEEHYLRDEVSQ